MAIRQPYDANDVFASPAEARCAQATVTDIPRDSFQESLDQPEVQAMVAAARRLSIEPEHELPQSLS